MATAFKALKSIGVIHTDLKMDNIMLVDCLSEPFRVKLIDFGLARLRSEAKQGSRLQPRAYRSPEIFLGLPFSEAVDMWSLGCVMSGLFTCRTLLPGKHEHDVMRFIIDLLGQPADHLLNAGSRTKELFVFRRARGWRLMKPKEYDGLSTDYREHSFRSLDELTEFNLKEEDRAELADRRRFVDLLKRMLQMDASERITPSEVLSHPFIAMSDLASSSHHSSHSARGTSTPGVILVQPMPPVSSPQAVLDPSSQSIYKLAHIPSLDTSKVGAPAASPTVDSAVVATPSVPLSSPTVDSAVVATPSVPLCSPTVDSAVVATPSVPLSGPTVDCAVVATPSVPLGSPTVDCAVVATPSVPLGSLLLTPPLL